jgi:uncharacterized membrane protein YkoI
MRTEMMIGAILVSITGSAASAAPRPHVSMQAARTAALSFVPHGRIRSGELETERGRQVYSFDIAVPNRAGIEEIQIDAADGKLISRRHETDAAEATEMRSEARERKRR